MNGTVLLALLPLLVLLVGFAVFCLVDIVRAPSTRALPKWAWALITVVSIPLGGILYLLLGRERS
ncbi:MAG TPA: PLDc N-terminal domain-containing protein [Jiangellales bacterium]|nr:PLDc N-terminal domain-containing protein [Jiangellales bacterium]